MNHSISERARRALTVLLGTIITGSVTAAPGLSREATVELPALHGPARILRDTDGLPHIHAQDLHDALYLQGWIQAEDRLFQLDAVRRQASGTYAELVGPAALASDVELRTIGLRRAAERSWQALPAAARADIEAYTAGINAWVERNPLPPEYAALELTQFEPWTPVDTMVVGKALAFQLSFDIDIGLTQTYAAYVAALGPALGTGVFFGDVYRAAPFDPAASVPDATGASAGAAASSTTAAGASMRAPTTGHALPAATKNGVPAVAPASMDVATAARLGGRYLERIRDIPLFKPALERAERRVGSNEWAVSATHTVDGRPLVANDPHLSLDLPPNFYQMQLVASKERIDVAGSSVIGTPWIVLGQNQFVTWGETTTGFDVTDTYLEQIAPDPASPSGLSIVHRGQLEPIIPVPLSFRVNQLDGIPDNVVPVPPGGPIPPVALTVPRRNDGPIVDLDLASGRAISIQYTGFSGTRELETFRRFMYVRNVDDFIEALQYFDVGSQNFIYGDIHGNIGYFTSGEVPLREDLQAGTIAGAPPIFIRDGTGGNEWLINPSPGPEDGTPYQALPFQELPQVVNPSTGRVVNANNDPAGVTLDNDPFNQLRPGGDGIYYIGYGFDGGTRAGRITQALDQRLAVGPVSAADMKAIQADVVLLDAQVLKPYIGAAFDAANAPGAPFLLASLAADPRIAAAVARLEAWQNDTPTGVPTGYDASDPADSLNEPSADEVAASIATTIYSVWRGQLIANGLDAPLAARGLPRPGSQESLRAIRHLLERDGLSITGAFNFFGPPPGLTAEQGRHFVVLRSLVEALDRLAGPAFAAAFAGSTDFDDYRWGRLHRITFDGLLGGASSAPPAGLEPSFPDLRGVATDGGYGVVDASSHNIRGDGDGDGLPDANGFGFGSGPNRRYVGVPGRGPGTIEAETALPGGNSGHVGSPFYTNLLRLWLTNEYHPLRLKTGEVMQNLLTQQEFRPAR
jgi:penicillin amidase